MKDVKQKKKLWKLHPRSAGYKPEDKNAEETDLRTWAHHANVKTVNDDLLISCCDRFDAMSSNNNDGNSSSSSSTTMTSVLSTGRKSLVSFTFSFAVDNAS